MPRLFSFRVCRQKKATLTVASPPVKLWIEVAALHPDVLSENFSEDIFALDLGPLADGSQSVPAVCRDAEHFSGAAFCAPSVGKRRSMPEESS